MTASAKSLILPVSLPCGATFFVDAEDFHVLNGYRAFSDKRHHTVYVRLRRPGVRSRHVYLHTLIIGGRADHRDGNGLNNTRANLRPCSQAQNGLNRSAMAGKRFKGVYQRGRKFYAQASLNGRTITRSGFLTEEDAARAYDELALGLHGEFARLNFPRGQ